VYCGINVPPALIETVPEIFQSLTVVAAACVPFVAKAAAV